MCIPEIEAECEYHACAGPSRSLNFTARGFMHPSLTCGAEEKPMTMILFAGKRSAKPEELQPQHNGRSLENINMALNIVKSKHVELEAVEQPGKDDQGHLCLLIVSQNIEKQLEIGPKEIRFKKAHRITS
ncbi:hypothetical protein R3P38DRAFT_2795247 [Favolaschia claudopus]|uniref:Uncharacterized protein n=1 Tax=Favolaschia claudopus TaxID=2862362 RepID=A0AAW0A7F3_9AGAR